MLTPKLDHFWTTRAHWVLNTINEAAYVEVGVIVLKIAHFAGSRAVTTYLKERIFERAGALFQTEHVPSEEIKSARTKQHAFTENSSVLLVRAVAIRALYTAATTGQIGPFQELITAAIQYDVDIACDILDHMSVVWDVKNSEAEDLAKLADIYIGAYSATLSNSIRTIALRKLADILEHLFQSGWLKRTDIMSKKFHDFGLSSLRRGSPDLSNIEIRMTGSLMALDFLHHIAQNNFGEIAERIQDWGDMLSDSGKSENVSILSPHFQTSFTESYERTSTHGMQPWQLCALSTAPAAQQYFPHRRLHSLYRLFWHYTTL